MILRSIYTLARPKNAIPPILSVIVGYLLANQSHQLGLYLLIACACLLLLNGYATIQNDIFDEKIDVSSGRTSPLIDHTIDSHSLRLINYVILLTALALPLLIHDYQMFAYLLLYVAGISLYNLPPFYASRRPLASIVLLPLLFSTLPLIIGLHVAQQSGISMFALFMIGSFLLRFSISMLKDYKDYQGDKKQRKYTFLVKFGPKITRQTSLLFGFFGSVCILAYTLTHTAFNFKPLTVWVLITLGLVMNQRLRFKLSPNKNRFAYNNQLFHQIVNYQNLIDAGIIVCLFYF